MPKGSKKKKDKAADFAKAKLKLGKGKQVASNAVDTSFKSRSITLPTQSIVLDKDVEIPTTKRKLTFDDLIAQLRHYNSGTRRDALLGLRELLETHRELLSSHLTALVNSCVRVISDEDASVRKTLLAFLGWLLRQIPPEDLIPHSPVLLLFTTSAQTHIYPEIRIDAIRFLDIFLEYIPDVVVEGWERGSGGHGRRVLEGYLGILNAGTSFGEGGDSGPVQATSTASVVLSPASKLAVLKSLSSFLTHALVSSLRVPDFASSPTSASPPTTPTWYLSSSFSSSVAFDCFESVFQPICSLSTGFSSSRRGFGPSRQWTQEIDPEVHFEHFPGDFAYAVAPIGAGWTLQDLTDVHAELQAKSQHAGQPSVEGTTEFVQAAHLAHTLHPTLVSTFLDSAPAVFSPSSSPTETELQMVLVVSEICRSLYGAILRDPGVSRILWTCEQLKIILGYFSPYFPFVVGGSGTSKREIKLDQAFQDVNLIFCELTSFLVLASPDASDAVHTSSRRPRAKRVPKHAASVSSAPLQISRVSEYVVGLLRGDVPSGTAQLPRPITPAAYMALLPTIWSLLSTVEEGASGAVLSVLVDHAIKVSSTSAVKRRTIDFLARLILLEREAEYRGAFRVGLDPETDKKLEEWIVHLPRTLWELGAGNLATTETILRFLLRLVQRKSCLLRRETASSLRSRLVPYFVITHATRGKLPGPFSKLPASSPLRRLALDAVVTLTRDGDDEGLAAVVDEAVVGAPQEAYWRSVRG
ncbi:hypothetical protein BKA93DRAFT_733535 [Sparassis latifolia]